MATAYTVQITGIPELQAKFNAVAQLKPIATMIDRLSLIAQRVARQGAPRDTATLQRSIVREVQPLMARIYSPLVYAPVMESGRAAGSTMPPPDALAGWAARHGFGTDKGTLFVLARAIARRGIKGRFFMKAAADAVQAAIPAEMSRAAGDIANTYGGTAAGGA